MNLDVSYVISLENQCVISENNRYLILIMFQMQNFFAFEGRSSSVDKIIPSADISLGICVYFSHVHDVFISLLDLSQCKF